VAEELEILGRVRVAVAKRLLFLPHAVRQMARPDRMITTQEVRTIIERGEFVEDYPEDVRGHSCLMVGRGEGSRPVHVVCSPKDDYLAIITAYLPDPEEWEPDFKTRKRL